MFLASPRLSSFEAGTEKDGENYVHSKMTPYIKIKEKGSPWALSPYDPSTNETETEEVNEDYEGD